MRSRRHTTAALLASLLGISACQQAASDATRRVVRVFAASSLAESFQELAGAYEREHPECDVELSFAGSQILRLQIEQGAPADVFASANIEHMRALTRADLVTSTHALARNELVIVTRTDLAISSLSDLAQAERIVIGAPEVPVGAYALEVIDRLPNDLAHSIRERIASREPNVRMARAKVELGEADAAFVYRTDALSSERVRLVAIPEAYNVQTSYSIGVVSQPAQGVAARSFVDFARSPLGQSILKRHGFSKELE